jgi:hypothetical protein
MRGTPTMHDASRIDGYIGDEPADPQGGVASTAKKGFQRPITHSQVARINGSWAIRDGDLFNMDQPAYVGPSNTPGEGELKRDREPRKAPKGFWGQVHDNSAVVQTGEAAIGKGQEYWQDPSKIGTDLKAAGSSVVDGAKAAPGAIAGAAKGVWNWATWDNIKAAPGQAWDAGSQYASDGVAATKELYQTGGASEVAGAVAGKTIDVVAGLINPEKKFKLVADAVKTAGDLEKGAKRARKVEDALEHGKPGHRTTRPEPEGHPHADRCKC